MNKQWVKHGLIVAISFQFLILMVEYLNSVYPIWFGQEIRLKTVPVDPRSLFRGNYARLGYDISRVQLIESGEKKPIRTGEKVYVKLKKGSDGLYVYERATLTKPNSGLFIRGRVQDTYVYSNSRVRVKYGIEAFFAKKKKALDLESRLRAGGVAVVRVAGNGKAALLDVEPLTHK